MKKMVPAHAGSKDSMSNALDFMKNNRTAVVIAGIAATAVAFYKGMHQEEKARVTLGFISSVNAQDIRLIDQSITRRLYQNQEINLSEAFYRNLEKRVNNRTKNELKETIERYNRALKKQTRLQESEPGAEELAELSSEKEHLAQSVGLIRHPDRLRAYHQKYERNADICYALAKTCGAATLVSFLIASAE